MSTRSSIKQLISPIEPNEGAIGDEWFNPLTNKLYKRVALNGTSVQYRELLTSVSPSVTTTGLTPLVLSTNENVNSGTITILPGSSGNIVLSPSGGGSVQLTSSIYSRGAFGMNSSTIFGNPLLYDVQDQAGTVVIEIGRTDGVASTSAIDFHAGAVATDFDVRMQVNAGNGVTGQGTFTITAASLNLNNTSAVAGTTNLATGATTSGVTKAVNIGTNGLSGSITNINIGSGVAGATGTTTLSNNITTPSNITSTKTWDATTGTGAQVYFNGTTGNRIDWNQNGVAAPAFTTRSAGAKLVLYSGISASSADYAIGMESSTMWFGVPTASTQFFKWYGGTTLAMQLASNGDLTVTGNLTVNGTTTTINSTVTTLDDPIFTLGGDTAPTVDDNKDRGIEFRWHNGTSAKVGFFGFDDSTGKFTFIPDATNTSEVFSGTPGTITANDLQIKDYPVNASMWSRSFALMGA